MRLVAVAVGIYACYIRISGIDTYLGTYSVAELSKAQMYGHADPIVDDVIDPRD